MNYEVLSREQLVELLDELLQRSERTHREQQDSIDEQGRLLHELRVYQVELEMQNRELRDAQIEIERSRDAYEALYDFAPVAYVTLDPDGLIEQLNRTARHLLGGSRESLVGRSFARLVCRPAAAEQFARLLERCEQEGDTQTAELELTVHGTRLHVQALVTSSAGEPGGLRRFRCALLDLTERKRAEEERDRAYASERSLHQRFESLDRLNVVMSTILATTERTSLQAVLTAVADNALLLLGAERACVTLSSRREGDPQLEIVRSRDPDAAEQGGLELRVPLRFGQRRIGELAIVLDAYRGPSRSEVGRTLELLAERVALALEIARLQHAEKRERQRLVLLERAGRELGSCTDLEGTLAALAQVSASTVPQFAAACAIFVREKAALRLLDLRHVEPRHERAARRFASQLAGPLAEDLLTRPRTLTLHANDASGPARVARALAVDQLVLIPMAARQQVLGVLCFGLCAGAAEEQGETLRTLSALAASAAASLDTMRLLEELRTAVESRDTLLAIVSHDLRSPLNAISLTARALTPLAPERDRRRSAPQLQLIQRSVARMSHLVEDLLTASNIDQGHFAIQLGPVPPRDLVEEACAMNEPFATARGITLECKCAVQSEDVCADRQRVLQVFTNLIVNGVKFTPRGGRLTVCAEQADEGVRFSVSDTGAGIPPHALGQVFVRYWTGGAQRSGLGLGLFIAERIVAAHNGRIWVESPPGKGATFHFTLPLVASADRTTLLLPTGNTSTRHEQNRSA